MAQPVKRSSDLESQDTEKHHPFGEHLDVNLLNINSDTETDDSAVPPQSPAVPEMAQPVQRNDLELQDIEKNHPFGERVDVNIIQRDNNSETEDIAVTPQSPAVLMAQPGKRNDLGLQGIEKPNPFGELVHGRLRRLDNTIEPEQIAVLEMMPRPAHHRDVEDIENIDQFVEPHDEPAPQPPSDNNPARTFQERVASFPSAIWAACRTFQEYVGRSFSYIWATHKIKCICGLAFLVAVSCLIYFSEDIERFFKMDCFDVTKDPDRIRVARSKDCGVIKTLGSGGLEEFPWMSRLVITGDSNSSCGGSIIHEQFVLTAARCCWNASLYPDKYQMVVRIGKYNSDSIKDCYRGGCAPKSTDLKIEKIIIQNDTAKINNFCLVKLKEKIRFSDEVYPVCLPTDCDMQIKLFDDDQLSAVGWVERSAGTKEPRNILQKVSLYTVPTHKCISQKDDNLICAFTRDGLRVCNEESGGPLLHETDITRPFRHYVVGVINGGINCSNPFHINELLKSPRVGPHLPWIFGNIIQNE